MTPNPRPMSAKSAANASHTVANPTRKRATTPTERVADETDSAVTPRRATPSASTASGAAKVSAVTQATPTSAGAGGTIADILDSDYRGISLYAVAMTVLVVAILWTGIKTAEQIQDYHHLYGKMNTLKKEFRQLQIERQRMLIEQQTFSATPQVTNRAVAELNMFYPNLSDRMIINANKVVTTDKGLPTASDEPVAASQSVEPLIDPSTQH